MKLFYFVKHKSDLLELGLVKLNGFFQHILEDLSISYSEVW